MTNYIVMQKVRSQHGLQVLTHTMSYIDLAEAKKDYDKMKRPSKKDKVYFSNQEIVTSLLLIDLGNYITQEPVKQEVLEEDIR